MVREVNEVDEEAHVILALINKVLVILRELREKGDSSGREGDAVPLLILAHVGEAFSPARARQ